MEKISEFNPDSYRDKRISGSDLRQGWKWIPALWLRPAQYEWTARPGVQMAIRNSEFEM